MAPLVALQAVGPLAMVDLHAEGHLKRTRARLRCRELLWSGAGLRFGMAAASGGGGGNQVTSWAWLRTSGFELYLRRSMETGLVVISGARRVAWQLPMPASASARAVAVASALATLPAQELEPKL